MSNVNLSAVILTYADLQNADLTQAILEDTDLKHAVLNRCNSYPGSLQNEILGCTVLPDGTAYKLEECGIHAPGVGILDE